ncbi:DsbA family oxidoreductase [Granulicella arctica]|uniref:Putative DsbA family dithiol-disulfide isomerase n=1 Tax=Granulicella arctica TaxID=940613 RepID=A0A7Y9PK26_9BACT|nr:DsbA family protein [Granulicella arctica]NYF80601.1 putative DsbA family dithiol-disulfide isomerase [Granulicella arctica]
MASLQIDYYGDINCPWCVVGEFRLDKVIAENFPGLSVDIRHRPFVLIEDCPKEGLKISDLLWSRYRVTDPQIAFAAPEAAAQIQG